MLFPRSYNLYEQSYESRTRTIYESIVQIVQAVLYKLGSGTRVRVPWVPGLAGVHCTFYPGRWPASRHPASCQLITCLPAYLLPCENKTPHIVNDMHVTPSRLQERVQGCKAARLQGSKAAREPESMPSIPCVIVCDPTERLYREYPLSMTTLTILCYTWYLCSKEQYHINQQSMSYSPSPS